MDRPRIGVRPPTLGHLLSYDHYCAESVAQADLRTRATRPLPDGHFRDLSGYTDEDPAVLGPWLAEGAAQLEDTLRAAGPDAAVWTPISGPGGERPRVLCPPHGARDVHPPG